MAPRDFWCEECQKWTPVCADPDDPEVFGCSICAGPYLCGECGFVIAREGNCLREEDTGVPCAG